MKHLRIPLLAAIIGTLIATPAFATQTRINSLSGGEKSITVRDQANIWALPQFLPTYGNQVDVDGTVGAKYGTMSVRYSLTDDAVLLLYGASSPWNKGQIVNTEKDSWSVHLGSSGEFHENIGQPISIDVHHLMFGG